MMTIPWLDSVFKGFIIYVIAFLVMRLMGKKQLVKLSPIEIVLLIVISETLRTGLFGSNPSTSSALILITVLVALNLIMNELIFRYKWFEKAIIGQPEVIILNGKIHNKILKRLKVSQTELFEALREHEVMTPEEVKCAILEIDGKISIIKYEH